MLSLLISLGLSLFLGAVACGQSLDELLDDLQAADAARRSAAVEKLSRAGAGAAPRLAGIVSSASSEAVRLAALEALSANSMAYAYSYLFWNELPPAGDADGEVADSDAARSRQVLWDCLVRVGDAFIAVGEFGAASDHYCDLFDSAADARERSSALRGLGRASRRRAAQVVFAALEDGDPVVRGAALDAVAILRWEQARPHLERVLKFAKPPLLAELLDALSRRREPQVAAIVERHLEHENPDVRAAAQRARARHEGFVTEWLVIGAVTAPERLTELGEGAAATRPREGAAVELGDEVLRWKTVRAAGAEGAVDTREALDRDATAWAYAEVVVESAVQVRLGLTCGRVVKLWLNGEQIEFPDEDAKAPPSATAELVAGTNRVLVHVSGKGARPGVFCLRLTDAAGDPVVVAPPTGES